MINSSGLEREVCAV